MRLWPTGLLLFAVLVTRAQQPFFEFRQVAELTNLNNVRSTTITQDESNSFYLTLFQKDFIERFYVSGKGKSVPLLLQSDEADDRFPVNAGIKNKIARIYREETFINGIIKGNQWVDVFRSNDKFRFLFLETDLKSGRSRITDTIKLDPRDEVVYSYQRKEKLFILTERSKDNSFLLYTVVPGEKPRSDTLNIDLPDMGHASRRLFTPAVNSLHDLRKIRPIVVLPNNLRLPPDLDKYRNKAITQDHNFLILINSTDLTTWLINIDLEKLIYSTRQFNPYEGKEAPEVPRSNTSFLIDSLMITAASSSKGIDLTCFNINTGSVVGNYSINSTNFNITSTSKPTKVGDFWARSNEEEISFEEFLERANNNQLLFSGYRENDQFFLTIGAPYTPFPSATTIGNLLTLRLLQFSEVKAPSIVSFNASFQIPNFIASRRPLKAVVRDKMLMHGFANRENMYKPIFFYMGGFFYLGYYNLTQRKYMVYQFDEKAE
jgi:hypothetical protein